MTRRNFMRCIENLKPKRLCKIACWVCLPGCVPASISLVVLLSIGGAANSFEFEGSLQQGGMVLGQVAPGSLVKLDGKVVPVTPRGDFVLGFGRDAGQTAALEVTNDAGVESYPLNIGQRQYAIQSIEGVPQRTVTPPENVLARIRREGAAVRRARSGFTGRTDFLTGFSSPLLGPITGVYGSQRIYNGIAKNPHYGLDIAGPEGALVRAPASGIVELVHPDMYYSGGTLIIDHGHGIFSTFIHLSEILVEEGKTIERGEPIARVGATGRATGPHLDWRINWHQVRLDPALVLEYFPGPEIDFESDLEIPRSE